MRLLLLTLLSFSLLQSPLSYALDSPSNRVILEVVGDINIMNRNQSAVFDLSMLQTLLPHKTVTTQNPWSQGAHTYEGFSAIDLLELLDNEGDLLQVTALNHYMTEIPLSDFVEHGAIFATHKDGQPISIRNLGPIMVIYPFDQDNSLKSEVFYGRSIWQIQKIKTIKTTE